ncbi:nuclear pore complex protein NUP85 [Cucumis sativus]|uniref:Nuclear pore complex protein Nup85 n=1 Tax=Cucumis sativus TaxID=3659 RepID=A0A0A0LLY0_CUCSA|nr:nuclear pore complex protein NUP85 [Cucumis sativus]KGN62813.1 hypothetical protein Csa_022565 [Cucumis sativus]
MPGPASDSSPSGALVLSSWEAREVVYPIRHELKPPIARLSISWARGNSFRVSIFTQHPANHTSDSNDGEVGGQVLEVKIRNGDGEISAAEFRRIAYGSVSPFALLQSRKHMVSGLSKMSMGLPRFNPDGWEYLAEYSKDISSVIGNPKLIPSSAIEDPLEILKKVEEPTCLKAAWELMDVFYADKQSHWWLNERLVDWLAEYDSVLSTTQSTIHSKLVDFQKELNNLQVVEDNPRYWDVILSALAVGWQEIVVKMLRLHGSYQLDQLSRRETENGLVEAVAFLISEMPRMRPELDSGKFGQCFKTKPDFTKAWEKWRSKITKLDGSGFWVHCTHVQTRKGLQNMLRIILGDVESLSGATCNWMELYISQLLYVRPFSMGLESMYNLAEKCMQLKPASNTDRLMALIIGILGESPEIVLAECSRGFGPWMATHAMELLIEENDEAETLLHEERHDLGGVSIEELHRLVYAQVLCSHAFTWQIAPIYLTSCAKQGIGFLETLLYSQAVQHNGVLLKNLEICRLYELDSLSSNIMKIAGVYHWKHGRKGCGVFWLKQARDEVRLNKIAQQLFDSVGKSISDESFKQWEGLIELLGSESKNTGGLEFLHKYRDFKKSLHQVHQKGKTTGAAQSAVDSLIALMKNPSTPQRFWLPILNDSLKLIDWHGGPLLNTEQTNLLLNKLQELSMAKLRPDFVESDLPPLALSSIRLALAKNLGRAFLEGC